MANLSDSLTFRHGATVNNRLVQSPMLTNSGQDGYATQDTIDYYNARYKTGGMIITEYMYVSKTGGPALTWKRGREQLAAYDDKFVSQLKKVAAAIKHSGNKAIMQIAHTGREANYRAMNGQPVYAPSALDFPFLPYKVHELSDEQIREIIADFGKAAKRAIDAGFDGVEIHGANHYLIQQFVSAYSNHRDDHWGGSVEKWMNFPLAVVKSVMDTVRQYAPKDFIVGYRISPEEIHGKNVGYTWHESTKLIDTITKQYDLDYIHLSMPHFDAKPGDAMLLDTDKAAQTIVSAMDQQGVKRLIWTSSLGIYNEIPGEFGRWNQQVLGGYYHHYRQADDVVENSDLEYTIIRPAWLTDLDEVDYETTHRDDPFKGTEVSRESVAALVVSLIDDPTKAIRDSLGVDKPGTDGDWPRKSVMAANGGYEPAEKEDIKLRFP